MTHVNTFSGVLKVLGILVYAGAFVLNAQTRTNWVTHTADEGTGSLRQVLAASQSNDVIQITATGVIQLAHGELRIDKPIVIQGPGATNLTISGSETTRVFRVDAGGALALRDITVANGQAYVGGGLVNYGGPVELTGCVFTNNTAVPLKLAKSYGATGWNYPLGYIVGSVFPYTSLSGWGGAIYNTGELSITNCTFAGNQAIGGDGGKSVESLHIMGGIGGDAGGGAVFNAHELVVVSSTFWGNKVIGGRGGDGDFTCTSSWMYFQVGYPDGLMGGDGMGACVYNTGKILAINSTYTENFSMGGSGGDGGTNRYSNSYLNKGCAGAGGDALGAAFYNKGILQMMHCTLARNNLDGGRGGVGNSFHHLRSPQMIAGAIFNDNGVASMACTIIADTITPYSVPLPASIYMRSNIVGEVIDGGFNLCSDASAAFTEPTSRMNVNPALLPLADNGGPAWTMALNAGSPAVDAIPASDSLSMDQRGQPRPEGDASDIGAFEGRIVTPLVVPAYPSGLAGVSGGAILLNPSINGYPVPTSYQWLKDGQVLGGATNAVLAITNMQSSDAGLYQLRVDNGFASIVSPSFEVTMNANLSSIGEALEATNLPWSTMHVLDAGNHPSWQVQSTNVHDGTTALCYEVREGQSRVALTTEVEGPGVLSFWTSAQSLSTKMFCIMDGTLPTTAWQDNAAYWRWMPNEIHIPEGRHAIAWQAEASTSSWPEPNIVYLDGVAYAHGSVVPVWSSVLIPTNSLSAGITTDIRALVLGTPPIRYDVYREGELILTQIQSPAFKFANQDSSVTLQFTNLQKNADYLLVVSNQFGSISTNFSLVVTSSAPYMVVQPHETPCTDGAAVHLNSIAGGSEPMSYQWRFNGMDLPGETNASLIISNMDASRYGDYQVRVANAMGAVVSSVAALLEPLPVSDVLDAPGFEWEVSSNAFWYGQTLTSSDGFGSARTFLDQSITNSSISTTVEYPGTISFSWWLNGSANSYFQFWVDGSLMTTLNGSAGQTNQWLSFSQTLDWGKHKLTWVLADPYDNALHPSACLDQVTFIAGAIPVTAQLVSPSDQHLAAQTMMQQAVTWSGTKPIFCQWSLNGQPISGATNPTYRIAQVSARDAGVYSVVVSNYYSLTNISGVRVAVDSRTLGESLGETNLVWQTGNASPWFSPDDMTMEGQPVLRCGSITATNISILNTTVGGPARLSFHYRMEQGGAAMAVYVDGTSYANIPVSTNWNAFEIPLDVGPHAIEWRCQPSAIDAAVPSAAYLADVRVDRVGFAPSLNIKMPYRIVDAGSNITLFAWPKTVAPARCQWYRNGAAIEGANALFLELTNMQTAICGEYMLHTENEFGVSDYVLNAGINMPLMESLNATNLVWTYQTYCSDYIGQNADTHDGSHAVLVRLNTHPATGASLSTTVVGPGWLRFWWKLRDSSSTLRCNFSYSITPNFPSASALSLTNGTGWQFAEVFIPTAKTNTLTWSFGSSSSSTYYFSQEDGMLLDEVSFEPLSDTTLENALEWTGNQLSVGSYQNPGSGGLWYGQTRVSHDGVDAAEVLIRTNDVKQRPALATTLQGPGILSFWYKIEAPTNEAVLRVLNMALYGDSTEWRKASVIISEGYNSFSFEFRTNSMSGLKNDARAWVDELTFIPGGVPPVIIQGPTNMVAMASGYISIQLNVVVASGTPPLQYILQRGNSVYRATTVSGFRLPGNVTNTGPWNLIVTNKYGSATNEFYLAVHPKDSKPGQPALGSIERASGGIKLNLQADEGWYYWLQTSTNLVDWENCQNIFNMPGGSSIESPVNTNEPVRYYRLMTQ